MAPKNLSKVKKHVGASEKNLHPNGRKLKQVVRATLRSDKLAKAAKTKVVQKEPQLERTLFFKKVVLTHDQPTFTENEIRVFIEGYLTPDLDELMELEQTRRPGRPTTKYHDALKLKIQQNQSEYKSGFKVPDLTNNDIVFLLRHWNEDMNGMNKIKYIQVRKNTE